MGFPVMPSRALPKSLYSRPPIGHPYNFRSQMVVIGIGEENPSRDIVGSFSERISAWFRTNIGEPTELQERSWRAIRNGRNVLIISPTGSGKTLAAVLPPVDDILTGRSKRSLTSILYVSPMKALGADLMRTLEGLSTGLGRIPGKKERKRGRVSSRFPPKDAPLEIGIRTGDVPQGVRRRMLLYPPDLLVITPENLLLMMCSKAGEILSGVRYVILDELHEMISSKRGSLLSLTLEYLSRKVVERTGREPLRIGLSATVRPTGLAASFMGGVGEGGKLRKVDIVENLVDKEIHLEVRTLFEGLKRSEETEERILDEVGELIRREKGSMVIFHNTRRNAEKMAFSLTGRGVEGVLPHHGSLSAEMRQEAEEGLKNGSLRAIVSSTSLELGIDIGTVSRICQISSPKDPGRLLQRLGRSGHGLGRISKGTIFPLDAVDLLECLSVSRAAALFHLESLRCQDAPMDVLAQFVVGASIMEDDQDERSLLRMVKRAYPYRKLRRREFHLLIELLTRRLPGPSQPPPRLWIEEGTGYLHPRRNTKQAFYLNCGTIPRETTFNVLDEKRKRMVGTLTRDFGESLYERDVILLSSRQYRIVGFKGNTIMVRPDPEAQPTVPSWSGEINPRPRMLSDHMMRLLGSGRVTRVLKGRSGMCVELDDDSISTLAALRSHLGERGLVPGKGRIPVEMLKQGRERVVYIFHLPMGRKVTEPLGRMLAYGLRRDLGASIDYLATDDGFAISSPTMLGEEQLVNGFGGEELERRILELTVSSSMFRTRFNQILSRSLLVLDRFRGKETGMLYRRSRSEKLLELALSCYDSGRGWKDVKGPLGGLVQLALESLNEVMRERMDVAAASSVVTDLMKGRARLHLASIENEPSVVGSSIVSTWSGSWSRKGKGKSQGEASGRSNLPRRRCRISILDPRVELRWRQGV
ncbi:hypothetical protein B6U90_07125 [Thermoplasmatales archaeon ex4484_6]|nr:MAG: hypothetical protein B6U90_07125 [Thermoplasmatales archaeon ex4484_6]